ncbi:transcriptional regulator, Nlp family [Tistlia consotensis]|uniref:Transcriptional regulator, Nlp family n=1 Tax=Tistlia consotensis USBA 355 TaxID=560819 RepID=A0A1Y6CYB1_9PROT|nr:helix-turn-helix domain-containing protein [Tistlia consotensis]SMF82842.1 transcriptional regulator, Nlp family [Tistlia consotensis USBA 355]SNS31031.1 transcriptional regulator, Nlp family [Tistlia consotensis]
MALANQHPEDVKAAVRKTGITLTALGIRAGIPGATVRKCLYTPCPKGNRVVADYLGLDLFALWPEWYDRDGNRLSSRSRKTSAARSAGHRQKAAAA